MVAVLAEERTFDDLVFFDVDAELEIPLAHWAAKDLHEVPLHWPPQAQRGT